MLSEALICHVKGGKQMVRHARIPDAQYREHRIPGTERQDFLLAIVTGSPEVCTLLAPPSPPIGGAHQTDASIAQPTGADSRDLLTGRSTRFGFGGDSTGLRPPVAASQSAMYPTWSSTERSVTSITSFGITELSISFSMVCWSRMKIVRSSYCDG